MPQKPLSNGKKKVILSVKKGGKRQSSVAKVTKVGASAARCWSSHA